MHASLPVALAATLALGCQAQPPPPHAPPPPAECSSPDGRPELPTEITATARSAAGDVRDELWAYRACFGGLVQGPCDSPDPGMARRAPVPELRPVLNALTRCHAAHAPPGSPFDERVTFAVAAGGEVTVARVEGSAPRRACATRCNAQTARELAGLRRRSTAGFGSGPVTISCHVSRYREERGREEGRR
jgi:hypothetical protein